MVLVSSVNNLSLSLSKLSLRIRRLGKVLPRMVLSFTHIFVYVVTPFSSAVVNELDSIGTLNPLVTIGIGIRQEFVIFTAVITWPDKKTIQL